ncbi:MAG: energy transducer TonB [Acidobacteriota bacterium]
MSKTRSLSLPEAHAADLGVEPGSPLMEAVKEGREIYSAAINAPNFSSKQGSWIFRFAELADAKEGPHRDGILSGEAPSRLTAPSATVKYDPRYPPEVIRQRVEGMVVLYAIIRQDGTVDPESVRVVRSLDPRLDQSAREALVRWKFKPSLKNGQPVSIRTEISIPFFFRRDGMYR